MRIPPFHNKIIIFSVLVNVKNTRRVGKKSNKNIFLYNEGIRNGDAIMEIGVIGLGKMGLNLALNLKERPSQSTRTRHF